MTFQHCHDVAHLHLSHLRSSFSGIPGQRLLRAYYATVVEGVGACGYVAEGDGVVLGYVCGVWEPSMVRIALLRKHWPDLIFWGTAQLVIRPNLATSFIGRIRESLTMTDVAEGGYELRPLVVAPSARGTGIGAELVAMLLADAGRRGFQRVHLFTEIDNVAANALYHKVGFLPTGIVCRSGIAYVRYERSVFETGKS